MSSSNGKKSYLERDRDVVTRPWSGNPLPIVSAKGCNVTDESGKTFLDFTSGYFVNQAGHCHPKIVEAATAQLSKVLQVSGKHTTPPVIELAERLTSSAPANLSEILFTTGGSESNEFAVKMARQKAGKAKLVCLDNGYHGLSLGVLGGCASASYRATSGLPDEEVTRHWYRIPEPYCYRCPVVDCCEVQCLDKVEAQIEAEPETAALITEPVQAVGGIIPPEAWWAKLDEIRKRRGLLLILDEVQTGMGRTGKMYAAEHYGLEPDIITVGKGISGGVGSLGGVLATPEVVAKFVGGTTPTSAGNAVSAAGGVALFDTIIDEKLLENCTKMGEYFAAAVLDLGDPWIGDARFKGLLGGVELVLDKDKKTVPSSAVMAKITAALHQDGMLLTVSGPHKNVLRLQPPLTVTADQLDQFVSALGRALPQVREAA